MQNACWLKMGKKPYSIFIYCSEKQSLIKKIWPDCQASFIGKTCFQVFAIELMLYGVKRLPFLISTNDRFCYLVAFKTFWLYALFSKNYLCG